MTGFTPEVRDAIRAGAQSSAAVIVPAILDAFPETATVLDVGCGEGWFLREFAERGLPGVGLDAASTDPVALRAEWFQPVDLTVHGSIMGPGVPRADLAVCLEVAEHFPETRAESLIAELCDAAPVVVFSAAIPGQGGVGHLNEQWQSWWALRFAGQGYACSTSLRDRLWHDERVESWYRQNVLVCASVPRLIAAGMLTHGPLDVVHPALWEAYRQ